MKALFSILLLLFSLVEMSAQEHRVTLTLGTPTNKTRNWLVENWTNASNIKLRYNYDINKFTVGGGITYTGYNIVWNKKYYFSNNNSFAQMSPFFNIGLNLQQDIIYFRPTINAGVSVLTTNINILNETNGVPYLGFSFDMDIAFSKDILLGVNTGYNVIFKKLDFNTTGLIVDSEIAKYDDKVIRSFMLEFNLVYRFEIKD